MDWKKLRSRVKVAILMADMDNWKDGTYPEDGEARKYADVAVEIIDGLSASQKADTSDEALPIARVVLSEERTELDCFICDGDGGSKDHQGEPCNECNGSGKQDN